MNLSAKGFSLDTRWLKCRASELSLKVTTGALIPLAAIFVLLRLAWVFLR